MANDRVGSSGTAPTIGARVELLDKMINTLDQVTLKVEAMATPNRSEHMTAADLERWAEKVS